MIYDDTKLFFIGLRDHAIFQENVMLTYFIIFQEGIKPMWEDEKNRHGGRWLINLDKKQRMTSLDNFWLEVMLCLIGESFEDHSQVVSAILNSIQGKKGG